MADWKTLAKATAAGAISGAVIGVLGFLLITSRQHPGMGMALFGLVPVVAGFSVALISRVPNSAAAAALLSVVGSLVLLIALGREGVLCALLAFPIILAGLFIGVGIGVLARKLLGKYSRNQTTMTGMLLLMAPVVIFTGGQMEGPSLLRPRTEVIQNSVEVHGAQEHVWNDILSIDSVRSSKPILMYVGLPVPQSCTMIGRGIGAKRTCYFNVGYIEETVTAWDPPNFLGLSIDRTHMPGRHWLGFESAEYRLRPSGGGILVTRTTTVISRLQPSWYWRPLERLGVESEHKYILQDLASRQ